MRDIFCGVTAYNSGYGVVTGAETLEEEFHWKNLGRRALLGWAGKWWG